ncbi:hypothetical protein [Listeria ivanovii]|uniref:Uncharacterized protein n=2 Tax=Listeria ivanovii TaxID=1638 RepID=A0ABS1G697_LISIV|nr:hypothetical protein [Listeria ivanovii]AIS60128.1 hypothetical protein JL58_09150 [Listeria ivanovii subsp. londoniensis]AIS62954.1 hypothetical protein JL53_09615 [Listeria ivanovii subsp. londoniensis]MBK1962397.1 hypothetical protein [Listeria ivanovii subsp. londoniensis]MBK1967379.1 hypothetical protein [Listeria ivanovii subsp. londoniensis]MBK1985330.1 hypothetical protein [Listeria ivanovii subsp. londoniensis]
MKIKTRQFSLNNVIGFSATLDSNKEIFDQVAEIGAEFKKVLIQNGYFADSPTIFEYNPFDESNDVTILSTVGNKINIVGENKSQFFYKERLDFTTNYYYRHYDQEEAIPYNEIKEKIDNEKGILLTIYHILLDLEGDIVIDLYCEVDKL